MPPYRTSMVRLVAYRREEFLDRHQPHAPSASKRPFLFLLSPDTVQLVTAADPAEGAAPQAAALLKQVSLAPAGERPPRRPAVRPLALLHRRGPRGGGAAPQGQPAPAGDDEHPGDDLEEGQFMTFSIALSQVADVEADDRRIKITFCRQRPHASTEANDDWKAVMKAMAFPLAFPYEGWKHKNFSVRGFMNRHYRDPFVSSVVLEADSPQDAVALHAAVEEAIARLAQAVHWLSVDLPLDSQPVVTLVTAAADAPEDEGDDGPQQLAGGGAASPGAAPPAAAGAGQQPPTVFCPFPQLQQPLRIPIPAAPALPAAARGSGKAATAPHDGSDGAQVNVSVWLHTALGPAVAMISDAELRASAAAGGAPVCVTATPQHGGPLSPAAAGAAGGGGGRNGLRVVLQFSATRRAATHRASGAAARPPGGAARGGGGGVGATLAVLAVPLLAAWLQLRADPSLPSLRVLQSIAFLVSAVGALAAIVLMQLLGRGGGAPCAPAAAPEAAPPAGWWHLVLLHAHLVRESQQPAAAEAGAPAVVRVVSSSPLPSARSVALPLDGAAPELPPAIRRLVEQHPGVLSPDIAARFLVGLGHGDKAYQALQNMVAWVAEQGVADLLSQPQPRFELIKRHYRQGFYCWSRGAADCVLEVERTGQWRAAFEALRAQGVTERELLRHQFFCMEYAFRVLDPRPLPAGKTVKIIDLQGLSMRDVTSAAFKWYLQVGGALLAVNYPQRLHKAFLLNAPSWSGVIWKVLAAVIPRRTREQLQLFTTKQRAEAAEALQRWVPADQLPEAYGGRCAVPLADSPLERDMLAFVRRLNRDSQQEAVERPQLAAGGGG